MANRNLTAVLILAAALAAPAFSEAQALSVGAETGTRTVLSRSDGEAQLHLLARSSATEEAWLLVGSTWVAIGFQEKRTSVSVDLRVAAAVLAPHGSADPPAFYHLHPFRADPRVIEPPSLHDIHSLALMKQECRALVGVILDGRGRWTFDLATGLQAVIAGAGGSAASYAASHGYGTVRDSGFLFDRTYPLIAWEVNSTNLGREERIRRFIASAARLGVIVTYAPIEP